MIATSVIFVATLTSINAFAVEQSNVNIDQNQGGGQRNFQSHDNTFGTKPTSQSPSTSPSIDTDALISILPNDASN